MGMNYIKVKIDYSKISKFRLRDDKQQTFICIISECSKLAEKDCKSSYHREGMVIPR